MYPIFSNQKLRVIIGASEDVTVILRGQVRINPGACNEEILTLNEVYELNVTTAGTVEYFTKDKINIPIGELISFSLSLSTSGIQRGQCFVQANILSTDNLTELGLCAGYVTSRKVVSLGFFEDSLSGQGYIQRGDIATPAAGGNIVIPSTNLLVKLLSIEFSFTTSATLGNRRVKVFRDAGGSWLSLSLAESTQAENITRYYGYNRLVTKEIQGTSVYQEVLGQSYGDGDSPLAIAAENMKIDDQFDEIFYVAEVWVKN